MIRELGATLGKELLLNDRPTDRCFAKVSVSQSVQAVSQSAGHYRILWRSVILYSVHSLALILSLSPLLSFTLARDDSSAVFAGASPSSLFPL